MSVFRYRARDKQGAVFTGTLETSREEDVATFLDTEGYIPVWIEEVRWDEVSFDTTFGRFLRVPLEELVIVTRQLETLFSAGLPFVAGLNAVIEQTEHKILKRVLEQVRKDVESGSSFADALSRHPKVFNQLYVSMIKAGEEGGVLDKMLARIATMFEHEIETRHRIKQATRYPKIVIIVLVAAFFILMTFVVPQFALIYKNLNAPLPLPTRIMILMHDLFHHYWHITSGVIITLIIGVKRYLQTETGRHQWDSLKLKLPVFGTIFLKVSLSRFAKIFGILHESGLPILNTLTIVAPIVGNVVIADVVTEILESVEKGQGMVQPMKNSKLFPALVVQMVAIGEETGQLSTMLTRISDYYDGAVDHSLKTLSSSLEPVLLIGIGGVVLFFALAVFMPWWGMGAAFRGTQ